MERMGGQGPIDRYLFDDFTFDLPVGLDAFKASLEDHFPDERRAVAVISKNLRALAGVQNDFAFFSPSPPLLDPDLFAPLGSYLSGMNCSTGLRGVLGVAAGWLGMPDSECPVFYHHLAWPPICSPPGASMDPSGPDRAFVSRFEALEEPSCAAIP